MTARYAIYFAPPRNSGLARFGDAWLGRDVETGSALPQPEVPELAPARLTALTEAPRHYGFHGTLKPPFRLARGCDVEDLKAKLAAFAGRQSSFAVPRFRLTAIGDFLALVPATANAALGTLACACVQIFDDFRAPPEAAELAKRIANGLTPRQTDLLARWGYPYVLDEFRFHLTLTGPIADALERDGAQSALARVAAPLLAEPVAVDGLSLFHQSNGGAPFRLIERFPFR